MQTPMSFLEPEKFENNMGTMNQAIDAVLEQVYQQFPLRIELYEPAY
jgi:hypothetical protein